MPIRGALLRFGSRFGRFSSIFTDETFKIKFMKSGHLQILRTKNWVSKFKNRDCRLRHGRGSLARLPMCRIAFSTLDATNVCRDRFDPATVCRDQFDPTSVCRGPLQIVSPGSWRGGFAGFRTSRICFCRLSRQAEPGEGDSQAS